MRQGIHLRGYAQKDPKQEYRREAFELYAELLDVIKADVIKTIMTVQIRSANELEQAAESMNEGITNLTDVQYQHAEASPELMGSIAESTEQAQPLSTPTVTPIKAGPKVGRNDPCPCGSGKNINCVTVH